MRGQTKAESVSRPLDFINFSFSFAPVRAILLQVLNLLPFVILMAEISKLLFDNTCKDLSCTLLIHPGFRSCLAGGLHQLILSIKGSYRYYALVYLVNFLIFLHLGSLGSPSKFTTNGSSRTELQMLMHGKWKTLKLKTLFKQYLTSGALGFAVSTSCTLMACAFRNIILKRFSYYAFSLLPATLSGIAIYLEPPGRRGLVINLFVNLVLEYWLRTLQRSGHIMVTPNKLTFLFMIGSALLLYLMRLEGNKKKRTPTLWFFTAEKVRTTTEICNESEKKTPCSHKGPCTKYIAYGVLKLFGFGAAISLAKHFISKIKTPLKALQMTQIKHFKLAIFLGTYIGIYRMVLCMLCHKNGGDEALFAIPSGFLAGVALKFNPSLALPIASLTSALKLYCTTLYEKKIIPESIPIPELLFCFCQGLLYHACFMHPEVCPGYVFTLMNTVSSNLFMANRDALQKACLRVSM